MKALNRRTNIYAFWNDIADFGLKRTPFASLAGGAHWSVHFNIHVMWLPEPFALPTAFFKEGPSSCPVSVHSGFLGSRWIAPAFSNTPLDSARLYTRVLSLPGAFGLVDLITPNSSAKKKIEEDGFPTK